MTGGWVDEVVDADGHPIDGCSGGVPADWIGTTLLPEGARPAGQEPEPEPEKAPRGK